MPAGRTIRSIASDGGFTTAGTAEETLDLSLDGAAAAATISVGAGTALVISDIVVATVSANAVNYRLQQDNGAGFFDVHVVRQAAGGGTLSLDNLYHRIVGGAAVLIRMRVETETGASDVYCTLRSYSEV